MNFKLGTYFGIPIHINVFTIICVLLIGLFTPSQTILPDGTVFKNANIFATGLMTIMFFFIILHEYGHCLMAKRLGWKVADIGIYPFGCIAKIGFKPRPMEELLVVIAGPFVNIIFALLFTAIFFISIYIDVKNMPYYITITVLFSINFLLAIFNLLPIFPMDGGRLLRATLSCFISYKNATWIAVKFGQVLAVLLICVCFYYEKYFMILILGFILFKSQEEITDSSIITSIQNIRKHTSIALNKPALLKTDLRGLIAELESVDGELKEKLAVAEILPLLRDFRAEGIVI